MGKEVCKKVWYLLVYFICKYDCIVLQLLWTPTYVHLCFKVSGVQPMSPPSSLDGSPGTPEEDRPARVIMFAMGTRRRCARCTGTYRLCTDCPDWGHVRDWDAAPRVRITSSGSSAASSPEDTPAAPPPSPRRPPVPSPPADRDPALPRLKIRFVRVPAPIPTNGRAPAPARWRVQRPVTPRAPQPTNPWCRKGQWNPNPRRDGWCMPYEAFEKGRPVIACSYHRLVGRVRPDRQGFMPPSCVRDGACRRAELFTVDSYRTL